MKNKPPLLLSAMTLLAGPSAQAVTLISTGFDNAGLTPGANAPSATALDTLPLGKPEGNPPVPGWITDAAISDISDLTAIHRTSSGTATGNGFARWPGNANDTSVNIATNLNGGNQVGFSFTFDVSGEVNLETLSLTGGVIQGQNGGRLGWPVDLHIGLSGGTLTNDLTDSVRLNSTTDGIPYVTHSP